MRMPDAREIAAKSNVTEECLFTGLIPQEKGPQYLAVADILVAPHVPNPDGTPFFGSPTKLFEYMAMGRGIVASNLDQIGEVSTTRKDRLAGETWRHRVALDGSEDTH